MVGQNGKGLCGKLTQALLVEPQVQKQRTEAGLQHAEKGGDPQGRVFHFDCKKGTFAAGEARVQHAGNAVGQRGQLGVARADGAPGAVLLCKNRVRKFLGKNAENVLEPALRGAEVAQLAFPKNHGVSSRYS